MGIQQKEGSAGTTNDFLVVLQSKKRTFNLVLPIRPALLFLSRPCFTMVLDAFPNVDYSYYADDC